MTPPAPTAPAVHCGDRSRPQSEVKLRAARLAAGLRALGVGHGDRVALVLRNEIEFLEATMAAAPIGAVPVPVNWHWTGTDLEHLLSDCGAKVVIAHTDLLPAVERFVGADVVVVEVTTTSALQQAYGLPAGLPVSGRHRTLEQVVAAHDPVTDPVTQPPMGLVYSSGTTGLAKGILRDPMTPHSAQLLVGHVARVFGLVPGSSTLVTAPMYHTSPNVHAVFAVALGVDLHVQVRFDPEATLSTIAGHGIASVQLVPTMMNRMLRLPTDVRSRYDVSSLRSVVHAAAPCPPAVKKAFIDWFGPVVSEFYGGSEGGIWTYCTAEDALDRPGTVGRAFGGAQVRVLGPDDQPLPPGETGVIYGTGMEGWPDFTYLGKPQLRAAVERDGFVTVGDVGHLDEDGYLYLSDRLNDMVVSGGVNVYPAEIEATLLEMDGIADVAVFGIPDPDLGEVVCAHVQPVPGAELTVADVQDFVRARLAGYKVPRRVVFDEQLPREDSGKLFKRRLKAAYQEAAATA